MHRGEPAQLLDQQCVAPRRRLTRRAGIAIGISKRWHLDGAPHQEPNKDSANRPQGTREYTLEKHRTPRKIRSKPSSKPQSSLAIRWSIVARPASITGQ